MLVAATREPTPRADKVFTADRLDFELVRPTFDVMLATSCTLAGAGAAILKLPRGAAYGKGRRRSWSKPAPVASERAQPTANTILIA